jgi:hypothetical protein
VVLAGEHGEWYVALQAALLLLVLVAPWTSGPAMAKKLDGRIELALAGRLHAKPVKLPPKPKAGPPPGGPDLAPLALQTTDLSGQATDAGRQYVPALLPLSFYQVYMHPAGQFDDLQQDIVWYPTANEASFTNDVLADQFGPGSLDLSGVGDGAWGVLDNGSTAGAALLFFSSGQLEEFVLLDSPKTLSSPPRQSPSPRPSPTKSTRPDSAANPSRTLRLKTARLAQCSEMTPERRGLTLPRAAP